MAQKRAHVRIYRDRKKEWRWTARAANGRKVATSGEGYKRLAGCEKGLRAARDVLALSWPWSGK